MYLHNHCEDFFRFRVLLPPFPTGVAGDEDDGGTTLESVPLTFVFGVLGATPFDFVAGGRALPAKDAIRSCTIQKGIEHTLQTMAFEEFHQSI